MKRIIVDKLPNCKKRYSASKDIIVCENGDIYIKRKSKYEKLNLYKRANIVQIYHGGKSLNVAKEVWLAFKGEIVKYSEYVIPKDGNIYNNAIDNLTKITKKEWYARNNYTQNCKVRNKLTGEIYPTLTEVAYIEKVSTSTLSNTLHHKFDYCIYPYLREKYEIIE